MPSRLILRLLVVFTRKLEILVTTLTFVTALDLDQLVSSKDLMEGNF